MSENGKNEVGKLGRGAVLASLTVAVAATVAGCGCPCRCGDKSCGAEKTPLEETFLNPPREAKPHTWYHMMNGNVTKAGITCDFEALAAAGIGGVQMFDAGCDIPAGGLDFNSPEWFDLFRHAEKEAQRLGLEICIPNCSGWSSSGGPWNPPSNGMKRVVHTVTSVKGPSAFGGVLPRTKDDHGYYADIAVLAVPDRALPPLRTVRHGEKDGVWSEEYAAAEELSGVIVDVQVNGWLWTGSVAVVIEGSADGAAFAKVTEREVRVATSGSVDAGEKYIDFGTPRKLKAIRVRTKKNNGGGKTRLADVRGTAVPVLAGIKGKTFELRTPIVSKLAPADASCVRKDEIVDLTSRLGPDGSLAWNVPAGNWKILRIGVVCNGRRNHPASDHGVGLEVDKLSSEALDYHFDQYVTRLCDTLGKRRDGREIGEGLGFNNILVDSYEVGSQNWTQKMESEFARRRGYSLRPYLPAFAGVTVGSLEETERFLEDFRRTVADLFAENYSGALQKKCHERGLMLSVEPYGNCPADNLQYGRYCDIPMGEFWSGAAGGNFTASCGNAKYVSYLAHVWGRKYCATESFTAQPQNGGRWMTTPFTIKTQGDHAYADGVNRIVYHRFTHQPWPGKKYVPGMTMGRWGMHLDRNQTWWDYSKPWFRYQAVCQAMLQRGTFAADFLFFCGEEAPNQGGNTDGGARSALKPPADFASDFCSADAIRALEVGEDGRLVSPGGVRYAALVLPDAEAMTPPMLESLLSLADRGAKLVGRTKPVRAPGLSFGKDGDANVRTLASKLWAHRNFIAGTPEDAIGKLGLRPDVLPVATMPKDWHFAWIHRREPGADWYFVCTANRKETEFEVSFRQSGKVPELWDAETGTIADADVWREGDGRTVVTIPMSVSGSKFVVFRRSSAGVRHAVAAKDVPKPVTVTREVTGAWEVEFPHAFAPNGTADAEGAPEKVVFDRLADWIDNPIEGVRYFSGTAVYRKDIEIGPAAAGARVLLDLGSVMNVAEVTVNGRTYPALWKPPFRVDITDAVKSGGTAKVAIRVANLWANRLIGDDRTKAPDCEWKGEKVNGTKEIGIKAIPDWVKRGEKSPTGRYTFTTWQHWDKDDRLQPSGLLGPVTIGLRRGSR